ncbi:hypothetical protein LOK49_LG09G01026 [Camellia lanceoleosa]|uniref:Uncharacterized protein n=1 Tax=Camellia lanceoleosa TaxID=1840588 RepID=A0ACC0GGU9_9ERIC|nr:hypothetical protein LOK49_LG09G01026 [Camellia lanceoleosa]
MAAYKAMGFAVDLGIRDIMVEGDSQNVISILECMEDSFSSFGHLTQSIILVGRACRSFSFGHVGKQGNGVAYRLARHAKQGPKLMVWMEEVSSYVSALVYAEIPH